MIDSAAYTPGPADLAHVNKVGDDWTLVLEKEIRHAPSLVWEAITDPAHLREWAPFDADESLGTTGASVKLTTVGSPTLHVTETIVRRAEPPHTLVYEWGGREMKWELEATASGTRLILWTSIPRPFIAMGAAGWHICFDVLERLLDGSPIGRTVGPDAMQFEGWQRLHAAYAEKFGIEMPKW